MREFTDSICGCGNQEVSQLKSEPSRGSQVDEAMVRRLEIQQERNSNHAFLRVGNQEVSELSEPGGFPM